MARFYQQLIHRIHAIPGVEAATASSSAPLVPEQLSWDGGALLESLENPRRTQILADIRRRITR